MVLAFVYIWRQHSTNMWYVGSRTNKNAHPLDGYICSSPMVKQKILDNPHDWNRHVIECSEDRLAMRDMETEILQLFDARNDPKSYNKHNNDGILCVPGCTPWNKDIKTGPCPSHSERMKGRTPWNKGSQGSYTTNKKGCKNPIAAENGRKGAEKVRESMLRLVECKSCGLIKTMAHSNACKSEKKK